MIQTSNSYCWAFQLFKISILNLFLIGGELLSSAVLVSAVFLEVFKGEKKVDSREVM